MAGRMDGLDKPRSVHPEMRYFLQDQGRRPAIAGLTTGIHWSISRINPAAGGIESDAEIAENGHLWIDTT